jgi:SAM-dependent methyltransferase
VATDVSEAMLASTRRRIGEHGADDLVEVHRLDMEDVGRPGWRAALGTVGDHPFDGAFSDFGAIDCVPDRRRLARGLGELVQPGGRLIVVTMPPVCPWEIGWHVLHGDPRTARRRWRSGALADTGGSRPIRVWYPSVRTIVHELAPWFRVVRRAGVGTLLPPTELAPAMERHPRVLALLQKLDAWAAMIPASAWAADHAIVEAVRA